MGMDLKGLTLDYITSTLQFENSFLTLVPSREEWDNNEVLGKSDIEVFTDGSKMDCGSTRQ
ncbi:hypothetical protein BC826DRAFT_1114214 [Russula brevipes]|nr:hypothetical protein BC826DRAFT_1114214 [Russula brevipes]